VRVCRTIAELRAARSRLPSPVGFVPTMGALHAGHESLLARARADCASTVASIYVNPLQFGAGEDLSRYPRPFEEDVAILDRHGVDLLFAPDDATMYPHVDRDRVTVDPGAVASHLEGRSRPGHFRGVATVVLKLLNAVSPDRAYFGQKDAQQLAVVRRMAAEFNLPVEIVACPVVREPDGLALSSRNRYLSPDERREAVNLSGALASIVRAAERGETRTSAMLREAEPLLGMLRRDYLAVVDPDHFVSLETLSPGKSYLAVGAVFCGTTRLIDNMELRVP
jgi:pantoate--beta-alanine ligase